MEELYPLILAILSGVFVGIIISIFYNHLRNTKNEKNALVYVISKVLIHQVVASFITPMLIHDYEQRVDL